MPVHLAGLPCDMDAIWKLARKHNLLVIEDSAHAAGAFYRGYPVGAGNLETGDHSDASVFSFYATKNLTTGEGGMVTTHSEEVAEALRILCLHGISKNAWNRYSDRGNWYYEVLRSGFKYNLSDLQSAIGIHQLRKLAQFTEIRTRYAQAYTQAFAGVEEFDAPPDKQECGHAWHLYTLRLNLDKLEINRDQFIVELKNRGVGTSVHFIPIPLHPFFERFAGKPANQTPKAISLYHRLVSLPLYPAMTDEQVEYVVKAVKDVAWHARKRKMVLV